MKFKFKLVLSTFLISLVSLVLLITTLGFVANASTIKNALVENQDVTEYISDSIDNYLTDLIRLSQTISRADVIEDALIISNQEFSVLSEQDRIDSMDSLNTIWIDTDNLEDPFIKERMDNDAANYLSSQQLNEPALFGEIFLTNKYGLAIATTGKLTTLTHYYKYWWEDSYDDGNGLVFIDDRGYDESVSGYVLGIVTPVYDEDDNIIGILKCNYNISEIFNESISYFHEQRTEGKFYVARTLGLIVNADSIEPLSESVDATIISLLAENTEISQEQKIDDKNYLLTISPITLTLSEEFIEFGGSYSSDDHSQGNLGEGWSVIYLLEKSVITSQVFSLILDVSYFGLALILIISVAALLIGGTLSKPITDLNKYILEVGTGNLEKKNLKIYKDEIGDLTTSFNALIDNLNNTLVSKNEILESRENLNLILNSTIEGMYGIDLQGNCTFVNNSFLKLLGYDDSNYFIGKDIHGLIHYNYEDGTIYPREECKIEIATLSGKKAIIGESVLFKKDGTFIYSEISTNPQYVNGEMVGAVVTFRDVTSIKKAEKALAVEKDLAKDYLDIAGVILFVIDNIGNITMMNKKGCELFGLTEAEMIGKNWFESFIPERNRKDLLKIFDEIIAKERLELDKYENTVINSKGEERYISWTNAFLKDEEDNVIGILSSGEDITEIKIANDRVKENEVKYRSLFEGAPFGYQSLDETGHFIDVNKKWLEIFGFKKEEVIGRFFGDFLVGEAKKTFETRFKLFKEKGTIKSKFTMKKSNNENIYVSFDGEIGLDEFNNFKQTHCSLEDITELTLANNQVQYETKLAQKYLNLANVMILVLDKDAIITLINKKGCEMLGLEESKILGKNWFDNFIPKSMVSKVKEIFQQTFENISEFSEYFENTIINAKGEERLISWHNSISYDSNNEVEGIISSGEDITDSKKKEKILLESEDRLNRSQVIAKVGSWELDLETGKIWASDEAFVIYGIKQVGNYIDLEEIQDVSDPKRRANLDKALHDLINDGKEYNITFKLNKTEKLTWINSRAELSRDKNGKPLKVLGVIRDITKIKEYENSLINISNHDFSTGLYNRRYFVEQFNNLNNVNNHPLGVMMIDVNGLKIINDAFGHDIGDNALEIVARVLLKSFRTKDIVARIGGDEFAIILPNITEEEIEDIKTSIKQSLKEDPIENIVISLATGYVIKTKDLKENLDEMLKLAENHMYRHKITEGISVRNKTIKAILKTLTDKFDEERIHSANVSKYCHKMGVALDYKEEDIKELEMAGMYHDIGKISIPDIILNKPGRLTDEEFEIIKTHPEISYQILRAADEYSELAIHALHHHERWDGLGYPAGLRGEDIPLFSRIICVVDAYEAMTSVRCYKRKMTKKDAVKEIIRCSGTQFDERISKVFVEKVLKMPWI